MGKSMRCLIVDRDPEAQIDLVAQLAAHAEIHVLAAVKTVAEVIPLLGLVPDVIFLDALLAEFEGFTTSSAGRRPYLIVALANDVKEAVAAYENYAIDFLLKPFTAQQIARSVTKLFVHVAGTAALAEAALRRGTPALEAIKVTGPSGTVVVNMGDVSLIKAGGNYARLTQFNGDAHMLRRTMVRFRKELAVTSFFQINRFTIINLAYVVRYHRTSRDRAYVHLMGVNGPLLLGRRAVSRLDEEYRARPHNPNLDASRLSCVRQVLQKWIGGKRVW